MPAAHSILGTFLNSVLVTFIRAIFDVSITFPRSLKNVGHNSFLARLNRRKRQIR